MLFGSNKDLMMLVNILSSETVLHVLKVTNDIKLIIYKWKRLKDSLKSQRKFLIKNRFKIKEFIRWKIFLCKNIKNLKLVDFILSRYLS